MERFLTARRSWTPGLVGWLAVLLSCNSGTGPETSPVHGGPDNPAADGSYTEAIASPDGIASLEPVTPGSPAIQYARFAFKPLERHFTVVTWDQRGCGKSYRAGIDPRSLTFEQLFSDAHELILLMRARFGAPRVFLMGISWAPLGLVEEYVAGLEAPSGKHMIPFEQSAHVVFLEERTLFRDVMIHTVMPYWN